MNIDDLERRLAVFASATQRLSRTIESTEAQAGVSSRPSSGHRPTVTGTPVTHDEISGLRPAISATTGATGALTARVRAGDGQPAPRFTSAIGKPAIPVLPAVVASDPVPVAVSTPWWRQRRSVLIAAAAVVAVVLLAPLILIRSFHELPDATVRAETTVINATASGLLSGMSLQIGMATTAGLALARIGEVVVVAPHDGIIARLLVTPDARVAAGEPLVEIARPETLRILVPLPATAVVESGERVSVRLLGQGRMCGGMVERLLPAGDTTLGPTSGLLRRAVIVLDPSPTPVQLDQSARVTPLGSREPGPLTQALFALRRLLP